MFESSVAKKLIAEFIREVWNEGKVEASSKYLAAKYTIRHDPGDPWHQQILDLEILHPDERAALLKRASEDPEVGYSYIFPSLELSVWRPPLPNNTSDPDGRCFRTIGVGRKGYYSEK